MGAVYRGIDQMVEREVAVKMLRVGFARQPEVIERFRSEAVMLARLLHPNIAALFSFFREGDEYFMVMEYVPGRSLEQMLRETGAIEPARAVALAAQALDALDYAHRIGIIAWRERLRIP